MSSAGARDHHDHARPFSFPELRLEVAGACVAGAFRGPCGLAVAADGRIGRVAAHAAGHGRAIDLRPSRCIAIPAFANAHVHLDLSSIPAESLPRSGFADWIEGLVAARNASGSAAGFERAVIRGAEELLRHGCAAIGDIDSTGAAWAALRRTPLEGVVFREWLGATVGPALAAANAAALAERSGAEGDRLRWGISPHAPYSTSAEVYATAFASARQHGVLVTSHVAESREEEAYLRERAGPLAELFRRWNVERRPGGDDALSPLSRLASLGPPRGFLVVHGNLLPAADLDACARNGWPLVHCPRSREWFGHPSPPLAEAARRGVLLALGTDSRASNPSLDPWQELATWRRHDRELADRALIAAATRGGRAALQLPPAELRDGEWATFQLVEPVDGADLGADEWPAVAVRGGLRTVALFIRGRVAWQAAHLPSLGGADLPPPG
ncbi:MAG: amidohydrolase family protein [Planctomycetes bacterium]|nr:amidohydrolase family protein [Planctomycetota bacterium]